MHATSLKTALNQVSGWQEEEQESMHKNGKITW